MDGVCFIIVFVRDLFVSLDDPLIMDDLCFIIVFICDLFVSRDDPLMS